MSNDLQGPLAPNSKSATSIDSTAFGTTWGSDLSATGAACLTPDALIAFVEMNLQSSDSQIQDLMHSVSESKKRITALNKIAADIRELKGQSRKVAGPAVVRTADDMDQHGFKVSRGANGDLQGVTTDDPALQGAADDLNTFLADWNSHSAEGDKMDSDGLEGIASKLDAAANQISGSSEIIMIQLHGLIQERTRTVQFASNTMTALGDSLKTEVGNIGR